MEIRSEFLRIVANKQIDRSETNRKTTTKA